MNWYGAIAMRHWERWRPRAYAGISDPDAFLTELGEEVAAQVEELSDYLAWGGPAGRGVPGPGGAPVYSPHGG